MKDKQVEIRRYKSGKIEYSIVSKKISIVLHSNGSKNIVVIEGQGRAVLWSGTYGMDTEISSIDIALFTDKYLAKFNGASVVTTAGKRYTVPRFNYFETELVPETSQYHAEEDEEIEEETIETADQTEEDEQMALIQKNIADWQEKSGLTEQ